MRRRGPGTRRAGRSNAGRPDLRPAVGARQAGEHPQPVADLARVAAQPLDVEQPGVRGPGGGQQAGDLVEDAEVLRDGAAVRVDVEQERSRARPGRSSAATPTATVVRPGRAGGSPHRQQPTGAGSRRRPSRRARRRPGATSSPAASTASARSSQLGRREDAGDAQPSQPLRLVVAQLLGGAHDEHAHPRPLRAWRRCRRPDRGGRVRRRRPRPGRCVALASRSVRSTQRLPSVRRRAAAFEPVEDLGLPGGTGRGHQDRDPRRVRASSLGGEEDGAAGQRGERRGQPRLLVLADADDDLPGGGGAERGAAARHRQHGDVVEHQHRARGVGAVDADRTRRPRGPG